MVRPRPNEPGETVRILIVDDDELTLELLHSDLTDEGYEVDRARNGAEALEIFRHEPCRMIISDWDMPEMNGLELCRAIREEALDAYVYLILLTSHRGPEEIITGMNAGADDFISKPHNPGELLVRLRAGERILGLDTRDMTIFALAKLAESRDPETGAHLERIRSYCGALARHLATKEKFKQTINQEYVRLIHETSPLHDIGKVAIPDCVLLKPGRLTDDEFEIMKTHTTRGAETLDAACRKYPQARFLQMAREITLSHHERFDGKGYPAGLAGEGIPLSGRITALADVYDALVSRRVYKDAFTHHVAKSIILEGKGTQFDPDMVDAFLEIEDQFVAFSRQYDDEQLSAAA